MKVERNVSFPTEIEEVKIKHLVEYMKLSDEQKKSDYNILFIFAGEIAKYMKSEDGKNTADVLRKLFHNNVDFVQTFEWEGVKYGFNPNLDDNLTLAEYSDINSLKEAGFWESAHKLATIFYRPITKQIGDDYQIEQYKGINEKLAKDWLELSARIPIGAIGFFLIIQIDLETTSQLSLRKAQKKELEQTYLANTASTIRSWFSQIKVISTLRR